MLLAAMMLICSKVMAAEEYNSEGYLQVTGPCGLAFPRDHGAHPGYRTEWWYYTGNLASGEGQSFGFQLTLFRSQISPPGQANAPAGKKSAWRTKQVYFGHVALSDIENGRHLQAEDMARGALEMAGAKQDSGITTIWLHNWSIRIGPNGHHLSASTPEFGLRLDNLPAKQPVLHGDRGYSRKGGGAGRASCYYSLTRMTAEGELTIGNRSIPVRGLSWMDHEFSTALLEPGIVGWDWFSLQLSNQSEIMFFLLRTGDGQLHPVSSGTFIDRSGSATHLELKDIAVSVLGRWESPASGAVYPSRWRLQLNRPDMDLNITANLADQEMKTGKTTGTVYWEGSVSVSGRSAGEEVTGAGYVELTGYAGGFDAAM